MDELEFIKDMNWEHDYFLITEKIPEELKNWNRVYYMDQINRKEPLALFKIIRLFIVGSRILKKEKPDCFISTGALISIPILLLGKLHGKKIIFIETFARVENGSLSGEIAYLFADVFIVYWKNLLKIYPKAVYIDPFEEGTYDIGNGRNTEIPI